MVIAECLTNSFQQELTFVDRNVPPLYLNPFKETFRRFICDKGGKYIHVKVTSP